MVSRRSLAAALCVGILLSGAEATRSYALPLPEVLPLPRVLTHMMPALGERVQKHWDTRNAHAQRVQNDLPLDDALPAARQAMRAGEAARAQYLAERVLDKDPEHLHALDQAGYASWIAEDYPRAIEHLEAAEALADTDALSPWRRAWLADAYLHTKDFERAILWAEKAEAISATYLPLHHAKATAARAHAQHPDHPDPHALADFLDQYPEYPEARDAHAELARAWYQNGDLNRTARAIDHAQQHYPWAPQAERLKALLEQDEALQKHLPTHDARAQLEQAKIWRNVRQWDTVEDALEQLEAHAKQEGDDDFWGEVRFEGAMNAMEIGDYTRADERFKRLKDNNWQGIEAWEGLRYYGWNLARLGKHDEALQTLLHAADVQGGQAGKDATFEYLYDLGEYKDAIAAHEDVSRGDRLDVFRQTMMHYLAGDYARARKEFEQRAQRTSGHDHYQASYWAARAALVLGDVSAAKQRWQRIVEQNPVDYYGLLAASRLQDLEVADLSDREDAQTVQLRRLPGRVHWAGPQNGAPADFQVANARASNIQAYAESLPDPEDLDSLVNAWAPLFPELTRVIALARIGADEDARQLYRNMVQETRQLRTSSRKPTAGKPVSIGGQLWAHRIDNRRGDGKRGWWGIALDAPAYPAPQDKNAAHEEALRQQDILAAGDDLIEAFIDIGRHIEAHYVVRQLVLKERGLRGIPPTEGDRRDWFEAYPRPFPLTVLTHTRRANLNPYLLWATIIVESAMNPDAISHASAYGLTQVIPKTGDRLAWELGDTTFGIHSLLDPHVSIRYGAWYLGKLTHKFENQESLALIGYNAGPHRVARWMDWRGEDMDADAFLEMVPFRGARNYHKQILRYMASYQRLYEGEQNIYIGLKLMMNYDETINF